MDDNSRYAGGHGPLSRPSAEKVFESVRRDAVTALSGVLAGFWGDIEEQVRLASIASPDSRAIYDDRLAIRLLSQRALELASRYREALETAFDQWRNLVATRHRRGSRSSEVAAAVPRPSRRSIRRPADSRTSC